MEVEGLLQHILQVELEQLEQLTLVGVEVLLDLIFLLIQEEQLADQE